VVEGDEQEGRTAPYPLKVGAQIGAAAMSTPWLYRVGSQMLKRLQAPLVSEGWIAKLPPPLNRWTMSRPFPAFAADFRRWWRSRKAGC
jgi:L-lactate dehydrogenase complex protein LldF